MLIHNELYKVCLSCVHQRTSANLVMILYSFVHSMGHSSFFHCIIQFEAKQKDQCRGCLHFPAGVISDFQVPWRSEWLQACTWHSTPAESSWFHCFSVWLGCAMQNSWESTWRLITDFLKFFPPKVAHWPPALPLTEVSNRAQFMNPEAGMFCLFVYKATTEYFFSTAWWWSWLLGDCMELAEPLWNL